MRKMTHHIRVLVTGAGSSNALSVIKALRLQDRFGVRITGTDTNAKRWCAGAHFTDSFHVVPPAGEAGYIPKLLKICAEERIELLIPIIDEELPVLAPLKERFSSLGTLLLLSPAPTIALCRNKLLTHAFFTENGIPAPRVWRDAQRVKLPVIFKPESGRGSRGIFIARTADDFSYGRKRFPRHFVQEFISGDEITVDVFCDLHSTPLAVVARRRVEIKAGVASKAVIIRHRAIEGISACICRAIGLIGGGNIQCIIGPDKKFYFIEVNPRFSSALPVTTHAGINMPLCALAIARGKNPGVFLNRQKSGVIMLRYWEECFV